MIFLIVTSNLIFIQKIESNPLFIFLSLLKEYIFSLQMYFEGTRESSFEMTGTGLSEKKKWLAPSIYF